MLQKILATTLLLLAAPTIMANEEPEYTVLQTTADFEIRQYEEYIVAEVDIERNMSEASGSAFQILAGYIFGDNNDREKMNMTAPVESRPDSSNDEASTYAFVMEKKFSLDTLPKPNDPRIRLQTRSERVMAVRRYSGAWSESSYEKHRNTLLDALRAANIEVISEPVWARYNGPFTPWPMRRNEVMFEIAYEPLIAAR